MIDFISCFIYELYWAAAVFVILFLIRGWNK